MNANEKMEEIFNVETQHFCLAYADTTLRAKDFKNRHLPETQVLCFYNRKINTPANLSGYLLPARHQRSPYTSSSYPMRFATWF